MENYSDENFVQQSRLIKFPEYSNYIYVNNAYQHFVTGFLSVINFGTPIRTLRVKTITKPF